MPENDRLFDLLHRLDRDDLLFLLRDGLGKTKIKYRYYSDEKLADCISMELRRAAGHGFANFFRTEHEFSYKAILVDVATIMSEGHPSAIYKKDDDHFEEEIELEILRLFDLKIERWWKRLGKAEKEEMAEEIAARIDTETVYRITRRDRVKHRLRKEILDSVLTKGIVIGLLAVSAGGTLGLFGGSQLTAIGWRTLVQVVGMNAAVNILRGIAGASGVSVTTLIGAITVGTAVFVPSTIYYYAGTDYKKTIPVIIMLLSKIHRGKNLFPAEPGRVQ